MTRVVLDLETCSTLALPTVGAAAYFEHPETRVTCAAWAVDDGPVTSWCLGDDAPTFPPGATFVAHNYLFELTAWEKLLTPIHGWPPPPGLEHWSCTMARGLYHALPASLDGLCTALRLAIRKDSDARKLMLQMARPRETQPVPTWWHVTDPRKLAELMNYCVQDVLAERLVDRVLPDLSPRERRVFQIDGAINIRGLRVDRPLVDRMAVLARDSVAYLDHEMRLLTGGRVKSTAQVGMLQTWLEFDQHCPVPDLRKHTVAEAIAAVPRAPPKARDALLVRQEAARSSTKKLAAMSRSLCRDGRLHGMFQYGGAGRTLRWAGRLAQPQNFPRGTIKRVDGALDLIMRGGAPEDIAMLWEDSVLGVIASCLRSCFIAAPGHALAVADLAQIEARVVCWLANQNDVLNVFASGADTYTYTARQQGSSDRQFGKVLILSCGFGVGGARFQSIAEGFGITLSLDQAVDAVRAWRARNDNICQFWWDVGRAAVNIANGQDGLTLPVGRVVLKRSKRALKITLPSGRDIIYHHVGLEPDDQGRLNLVFWGVDPKTKQWSKQRTYGGKLCLTGETLVLTRTGWTPLVDLTAEQCVWDGENWVSHAGVTDNGLAQVITVDGVGMTPGHQVLTMKGWVDGQACEGLERCPVTLPDGDAAYRFSSAISQTDLGDPLRLWPRDRDDFERISEGPAEIVRLPAWGIDQRSPANSRYEHASGLFGLAFDERSVPADDTSCLAQLRRTRHRGVRSLAGVFRGVLARHGNDLPIWLVDRPRQQRRGLFTGELRVAKPREASQQPPENGVDRYSVGSAAADRGSATVWRQADDTSLPSESRLSRVYDILDAGRHHRFVVAGETGPLIVHNCENIVQATARDVMAETMMALDDAGVPLVGTIHDEVIAEPLMNEARDTLDLMLRTMRKTPSWAAGLPLAAEGWTGVRYRKA